MLVTVVLRPFSAVMVTLNRNIRHDDDDADLDGEGLLEEFAAFVDSGTDSRRRRSPAAPKNIQNWSFASNGL